MDENHYQLDITSQYGWRMIERMEIHPSIPTGLSWRHGTIQMGCRARETARYASRTLAEVPWFGGVAATGG